jgi:hypothetical protein
LVGNKGIGARVLHVLQEHKIDINQCVAEFWPEFVSRQRKDHAAQLLSHQAGLARSIDESMSSTTAQSFARLKRKNRYGCPNRAWLSRAHLGFPWMNSCAASLGNRWQNTGERSGEPLKLYFCIGLPERQNPRVATMYAAKAGKPPEPKQFYADLITPGTLARKTFTSPYGLHAVNAMNDFSVRAQPIVSFGGIGSASSLAKFYAMLANGGTWEDRQFFRGNFALDDDHAGRWH